MSAAGASATDVAIEVSLYLCPHEILSCASVSKQWYKNYRRNEVWQRLCDDFLRLWNSNNRCMWHRGWMRQQMLHVSTLHQLLKLQSLSQQCISNITNTSPHYIATPLREITCLKVVNVVNDEVVLAAGTYHPKTFFLLVARKDEVIRIPLRHIVAAPVWKIAQSPTNVAAVLLDGFVSTYDVDTFSNLQYNMLHEDRISSIAYNATHNMYATGSLQQYCMLWDVSFRHSTRIDVPRGCIDMDSVDHMLTIGSYNYIYSYDLRMTAQPQHVYSIDKGRNTYAVLHVSAPFGEYIAFATQSGSLGAIHLRSNQVYESRFHWTACF